MVRVTHTVLTLGSYGIRRVSVTPSGGHSLGTSECTFPAALTVSYDPCSVPRGGSEESL